jgi:putative Mn2+ efflux pump MntP
MRILASSGPSSNLVLITATGPLMLMISGLMALAGLKLGNVIGRYLPIRSDVLSGVALVFVAVTPNKPGAERT